MSLRQLTRACTTRVTRAWAGGTQRPDYSAELRWRSRPTIAKPRTAARVLNDVWRMHAGNREGNPMRESIGSFHRGWLVACVVSIAITAPALADDSEPSRIRPARRIEKFDADGDGKLSEEESQKAREQETKIPRREWYFLASRAPLTYDSVLRSARRSLCVGSPSFHSPLLCRVDFAPRRRGSIESSPGEVGSHEASNYGLGHRFGCGRLRTRPSCAARRSKPTDL